MLHCLLIMMDTLVPVGFHLDTTVVFVCCVLKKDGHEDRGVNLSA